LELANVLLQAERRGRLSVRDVATRLALLDALPYRDRWRGAGADAG
jgi:hypothetical protein